MGKIIRRILTIIPAVALQSLWLLLLMKWLTPYAPIIVSLLSVAAFFLVVFIIIKRDETAYKLLWLLVILSLPLVGALLYLLFGNKRTARPLKRRLQQVQKSCNPQPLPIKEAPFDGEKRMGQTVRWLEEKTQYPMCAVEQVRYYPLGDNMFPDMLADLKNARNSIYVEYFIIEPGHMWDAIVNELEVKMEQGVDVRVIYDDLGSISSFNFSNVRELKKKGIPCIPFNPFLALKGTANYRDHRKMLIIDNEVAYSGGINLSDRYINLEHPYGHWKDTGFRITGEPVKNFTHMFLTFWNAFSLEKEAGQLAMPTYPKRYPAPPHTFDSQVHVLGTVNNVPQLMQASDLFLTKPGGLSTSEAMAAELPMVLIDAVAGCETHNLNFFLRNGMAVTANTPKAIADTTIKTLNAPVLLSKMRAAMRSQTECTAADKIYEWIYSHAK